MGGDAQRIQPSRSLRGAVYRLVDACCIVWGLLLAASYTWLPTDHLVLAGSIGVVVFYIVGELSGMYRSWRGESAGREMFSALATWGVTLVVILTVAFLTRYLDVLPRSAVMVWFLSTPMLIVLSRILLRGIQRFLLAHGVNARRFAIVGVNDLGVHLARNIESSPELGLRRVGFFDDRPASRTGELPDDLGPAVGDLNELVKEAREGKVDRIYITFPMRAEARIKRVLERLGDTTASVYIVPDFFVFELLHSRWSNIAGLPAVSITENPFYGVDGLSKRICDIILASAALLLVSLPMLVIAAAVKLTSPGPVFFRQKRYGLDGREIRVWKFRTMTVCEDGPQVTQAKVGDQRVTRVGAVLRKTSLDELPQLFNVLGGSMSLVGPRPHATAHNEQYRKLIPGYMLRHKVKPGITGLAQVNGCRGETDTLDKMRKRVGFDHRYIREWSLWLDLSILLRTLSVVWKQQNAY